jgi:hypothetical protein
MHRLIFNSSIGIGVDPQLAAFGTKPVLTGFFLAPHGIQLLCGMMYKKRISLISQVS